MLIPDIYFQVIQYQEQSNLAFLLLVKSLNQDDPVNLKELIKYCLLPEPPSLGTPCFFSLSRTKPHSALPSGRRHPRICALPQGRHVHPRRHGAAPYPYRPVVRYAYKFLIRWWLRSTSCSRLTVTIHNLSKPRRP